MTKWLRDNWMVLAVVLGTVALMLLLMTATGCAHKPPVPPGTALTITGQTVSEGAALPSVTVIHGPYTTTSAGKGKFKLESSTAVGDALKVEFVKLGYDPRAVALPAGASGTVPLGQVELHKTETPRDWATAKIRSFGDYDGAYFTEDKWQAVCEETKRIGGTAVMICPDRSGFAYMQDCEADLGKSWEAYIRDNGYFPQFGLYEDAYANIHNVEEVNAAWVSLVERKVAIAKECGLWCLVVLYSPLDTKHTGNRWWHWGDCNESPYNLSDADFLRWQLRAQDALLPALAGHENLVLADNWEGDGRPGSVSLAWKQAIYENAKWHCPDVPYYVYHDGDEAGDVLGWINATPGVTGLHCHYCTFEDYAGLATGKELLITEEGWMHMERALEAYQWADAQPRTIRQVYFWTAFRKYRMTDGGEDTAAGERAAVSATLAPYYAAN
jgi:hypothetical protein